MTTAQLQRYGKLVSGSGFPIEDQDVQGEALPFFKVADISAASQDGALLWPGSSISRDTAIRLRAAVIPQGATVLPKIGAALLGNRRALTTMPSCIDNNVLALVPSQRLLPRFGYYLMTTIDSAKFALPGPVPSMDVRALGQSQVQVPEIAVQHAIAGYLDRETARIDALVAAKRRMVEVLGERLAAWTHATLVGGQESFGSVPLKAVARWVEGPGIMAHDFRDDGVPLLRIRNLVGDTIDLDGCGYVSPELGLSRWNHLRVHAGELLISGSARSGTPVVVPPEAEGALPYTGLIRLWPTSRRLHRDYLRARVSAFWA